MNIGSKVLVLPERLGLLHSQLGRSRVGSQTLHQIHVRLVGIGGFAGITYSLSSLSQHGQRGLGAHRSKSAVDGSLLCFVSPVLPQQQEGLGSSKLLLLHSVGKSRLIRSL